MGDLGCVGTGMSRSRVWEGAQQECELPTDIPLSQFHEVSKKFGKI